MNFDPSSRAKLGPRSAYHFPDDTLFHRVARVVCDADCLPRKELFESWEVARRARRRFRGGNIVDLACGHALVAHLMLLLDDSSETAWASDVRIPASAKKLADALARQWPRLAGRVTITQSAISGAPVSAGDVVVSAHACGNLTDDVITKAIEASARVVVLPCCHDKTLGDRGGMEGWLDAPMAIDVTRAGRLRAHGYAVYTQHIPATITPKNRLLMAEPAPR